MKEHWLSFMWGLGRFYNERETKSDIGKFEIMTSKLYLKFRRKNQSGKRTNFFLGC